jgi:uncharacterized protein
MAHLWTVERNGAQAGAEVVGDSGVFNFTAPEVVSQKAFNQCAARLLHRPCILPTPAWPLRLMLGEQADLLLEGQKVVPTRLLESGFEFSYPQLEKALRSFL